MIKTQTDRIIYQDENKKFTVEVLEDSTNQTRTITSLTGPGISGAISAGEETDTFLQLMYFIKQDLHL